MPFDGTPRPRPSTEEISNAYESLVRLEEFFDGGRNWHRGELRDGHGSFCLIGAMDRSSLRRPHAPVSGAGGAGEARTLSVRPAGSRRDERSLRRLRGTPRLPRCGSGAGDLRPEAIDAFGCVTLIPSRLSLRGRKASRPPLRGPFGLRALTLPTRFGFQITCDGTKNRVPAPNKEPTQAFRQAVPDPGNSNRSHWPRKTVHKAQKCPLLANVTR